MLKRFSGVATISALLFIISFLTIAIVSFGFFNSGPTYNYKNFVSPLADSPKPEIYGWIAWWDEEKGYDLVQKTRGKIKTVSPVWFMVDQNLQLNNVGKIDREIVIKDLKKKGVIIYPSLGSEVSGKELGPLLKNSKKVDTLVNQLIIKLKVLGVNGVDIDIEGIEKKDKDAFTQFLVKLDNKLEENKLKITVAVHAKTKDIVWEGSEGQDLEQIGNLADEVRIMLYDEHSAGSNPGPISSYKWMVDVVKYTELFVPRQKIVIGIPSYGYIWNNNDSKGLQFDEFNQYLLHKSYNEKRDANSGELIFEGDDFTGWLSDSNAMVSKINLLRAEGLNKFIIWHLGGMDSSFFSKLLIN